MKTILMPEKWQVCYLLFPIPLSPRNAHHNQRTLQRACNINFFARVYENDQVL